jgi:hypothetical protein
MNAKPTRKVTGSNEALLIALACGSTVEAAAAKAGLGERTVYRRLEDPDFREKLQEFRGKMVERASAMLSASGMEAVKTLLGLLERSIPHVVRLGAAKAILELGMKLRDLLEVEQRLAALEKAVMSNNSQKQLRR